MNSQGSALTALRAVQGILRWRRRGSLKCYFERKLLNYVWQKAWGRVSSRHAASSDPRVRDVGGPIRRSALTHDPDLLAAAVFPQNHNAHHHRAGQHNHPHIDRGRDARVDWTEMGINLGLDIGAISLKLAALGKPGIALSSRPLREPPAVPPHRLGGRPAGAFRLPPHRRQPHPVHLRSLREFYETVPSIALKAFASPDRAAAPSPRCWACSSKTSSAPSPHDRVGLPAGAHGIRDRRRELQIYSPGWRQHRGLRPLGRMRRRHGFVPRSAGAAHAVLGGRGGVRGLRAPVARRGSPDAARFSPRAT
jgi:hypothetical protein